MREFEAQWRARDWVRMPSVDPPAPPCLVSLPEIPHALGGRFTDMPAGVLLAVLCARLKSESDPLDVLELFVASLRLGLYPPREVLETIEGWFAQWLRAKGVTTLDKIAGLSAKRGGTPALRARAIRQRNLTLFVEMARLIDLGATQAQAAEMVARRLEATPDWNQSGHTLERLDAGSLERMFQAADPDTRAAWAEEAARERPIGARLREYLALFPADAAPDFMPAERKSVVSIRSRARK